MTSPFREPAYFESPGGSAAGPARCAADGAVTALFAHHPAGAPAMRSPAGTVTYGRLRDDVERLAGTLRGAGLGPGDRIGVILPHGPALLTCLLAAATVGAVVPLNPRYAAADLKAHLDDAGARALVIAPSLRTEPVDAALGALGVLSARTGAERVALDVARVPRRPPAQGADDTALVLHTSGTTSRPKRVPLTHANLAASARNIVATYRLGPEDRTLAIMPLFHIHGIVASCLATLAAGGTVIVPSGFNALEFWSLVDRFAPTWYSAVPTMHQAIVGRADVNRDVVRRRRLRFVRSCSAHLPAPLLARLETVLDAPVLEAYGMTEAAHQIASNPPPPGARKPGTVGPGRGVEVGIMDAEGAWLPAGGRGEVVVRGASVVSGYEDNPEANRAAFVGRWFRTGDEGVLDGDGYLTLTGRLKDIINRGGEKIAPVEIDHALLGHPAVVEAIAFPVHHRALGEDVHAAVVVRHPVSTRELHEHCRRTLAEFKVPRRIHLVDKLPTGATGKPQRRLMAQHLDLDLPEAG